MSEILHVAGDLAKGNLYTELTPKDLEWTLASGSATETQTFYLSTKEGYFAFVQMVHSNLRYLMMNKERVVVSFEFKILNILLCSLWSPTIQFTARFFGGGINTFKCVNMTNFKLSP